MKKMAKAMAWFTSGSLIGTATQIVKGKLGAVFLSVDGVGVLSQLSNAWGVLNVVSGLSFYNGIVQRIAAADTAGDRNALLGQLNSSLIFLTGFSCTIALLSLGFSGHISNLIFDDGGDKADLVALVALSVPFAVTAQIYNGLLSGCRLVRPVVAVQVCSDILSLVLFIMLLLPFGLLGATLAFSFSQLIKLIVQIYVVSRNFGIQTVIPSLKYFQWPEVKSNIIFSSNGLILLLLAMLSVLIVSRWIISSIGLEANGIFSVAWKVASLYLGAIYAAAGGYYFPSLVECLESKQLCRKINETLSLYLFILPPIIIAIIIGGKPLIAALFSSEFVAASVLLSVLLPGDIFRVSAETIGLSFLARRELASYTISYIVWTLIFLAASYILIKRYGLLGVAYAYTGSHFINMLVIWILANSSFDYQPSLQVIRAWILGITTITLAGIIYFIDINVASRYFVGGLLIVLWFFISMKDESFSNLFFSFLKKVRVYVRPNG